ncbi:MAG: aromatic ring-hydroxylating oxygenase subunit alpha, partial [Gaiellales bacterium]
MTLGTFARSDVAAGLADGYTLPGRWYTERSVFDAELEHVFGRFWQYAGRADMVASPGDFFTCRLGNVPVVVSRDAKGQLNAYVNVCRHRGSEVVLEPCGNRRTFQCHYHAWTYGLDGRLLAAPRAADEPGFDKSRFALEPLRVEQWGPLVFVCPDPSAPPFAEQMHPLHDLVRGTGVKLEDLRSRDRREYDIRANWKVVVENFLECYHCPVSHPAFTDLIDLDNYHLDEYELFSSQGGPVKAAKDDAGGGVYEVADGEVEQGLYNYLWPNFMLNIYPGPGNVSTNVIIPLGVDRTLAVYEFFFADDVGDDRAREIVDFIDQVQREDVVLCESVQRGLGSGRLDRGKLMLAHEHGLQHFQK